MKSNSLLSSLVLVVNLIVSPFGMMNCFAQEPHLQQPSDFENVTVEQSANRVYYEQRLYRNPLKGMLKLAPQLAERTDFVSLYQGVPMARYRLAPFFSTTLLSAVERTNFRKAVPFERRKYKLDFRLQPEFIARFGHREQPLQSKTNLLLQSQFYVSRGLVLNWGVVFPIVNDLDTRGLNVRPAPIFLNQFLALDQTNFLSASLGLFYTDRYGLNVQYRHTDLTKPWSFGIETSLTGVYYFLKGGLNYTHPNEVMALADIAYRLPVRDVTLKLSGGQYLYQDRGARFDLIRQFSNVEIGFYIMKTVNGSTGGFNFAIPIPPGRIVQTQHLRLRSTEEFRWEYAYTRGYAIGNRYRVGYQLDALLRQYHHDYLRNQLLYQANP